METWDELDKELESDKDDEANFALMATIASDVEPEIDSDDDEVLSKLTQEEWVDIVKELVSRCLNKSKASMTLQ